MAIFLAPLPIADFDYRAAEAYGGIRADLEGGSAPIGPLDALTRAHAVSLDEVLLTTSAGEFSRVPRLHVEDWTIAG